MKTILQVYIQSINSLLQRFDSDSLFTAKLVASLTLLLNAQAFLYFFGMYPIFESTDFIKHILFTLVLVVLFLAVHLATKGDPQAFDRANHLVKNKPYIVVSCWVWFACSLFVFPLL